jgi:hypothetical protein
MLITVSAPSRAVPRQNPPASIDRHICSVQTTPRMSFTRTDSVNIPDLPLLHSEQMTIRRRFLTRSIQARKPDVDIDCTILDVNDIPPVNKLDS